MWSALRRLVNEVNAPARRSSRLPRSDCAIFSASLVLAPGRAQR